MLFIALNGHREVDDRIGPYGLVGSCTVMGQKL